MYDNKQNQAAKSRRTAVTSSTIIAQLAPNTASCCFVDFAQFGLADG